MKILGLILTILFVSCGELERVDTGIPSDSDLGKIRAIDDSKKLEASEILLLRDICLGLSDKQDYIKNLLNVEPSLSIDISTSMKDCDDEEVSTVVVSTGFSTSVSGLLSLSATALHFNDLVTNTTSGLSDFCTASSALEVNRQQLNASKSIMKEFSVLANNNSKCGASSAYACLLVLTSRSNGLGGFLGEIEDIYVIHKTESFKNVLKRRDRNTICTDKTKVRKYSQAL